MRIWPLGVGGWMPMYGRQTSATLIEYKETLVIVDAGTGISNLASYETILNKYDEVHLVLTHYHMDHMMGLFFLNKFVENKKLTIWGPGKPHYEKSVDSVLKACFSQPIATHGYETMAESVTCRSYDESGMRVGNIDVQVLKQVHTLPSFGLTFGGLFHIATDTVVLKETLSLPVKLIFHECWVKEKKDAAEHSSVEEILEVLEQLDANRESIPSVGLIHRNPDYADTAYIGWLESPLFLVQENQLIEIEEN